MHIANPQRMSGSESPPPYFKSHMAYNYECERLSTRIPFCKLEKCGKYIQYYYVFCVWKQFEMPMKCLCVACLGEGVIRFWGGFWHVVEMPLKYL